MNKADLSAKWSKYCNTNELVDNVMTLLTKYRHRNSEHGVCTLLDTYFTNKEPLIRLFVTSHNYIGDMRIALKKNFERQPSQTELNGFFCTHSTLFDGNKLFQFADEDGKKMVDYLNTGKSAMNVFNMTATKANEKLRNFNYYNSATKTSHNLVKAFSDYLSLFRSMPYATMQRNYQFYEDKNAPTLVKGMKTSRAFNKVCVHYGFDKDPGYNKAFAQYADLVSDLTREMDFIMSLNPLDYLTMSFGVSWESCHNIRRGGWMGGCLSYMLDNTSIITFVVNGIEGPIHNIPKVYRQMFHYDGDMFVQSRLYPQGNDGAVNLYDKFRGIVTEEFNSLLNVDNEWETCAEDYNTVDHIESRGSHYRDYGYNRNCRTFYHRTKVNQMQNHVMNVGRESICVHCGKPLKEKGRLEHGTCISTSTVEHVPVTDSSAIFTITLDDWA